MNQVPTEVVEKAQRRRFTGDYKRRILREADNCKKQGELGALLRREGLYSSLLATWRRQAERAGSISLDAKQRGPIAKAVDPLARKMVEQQREMTSWKKRAIRAEAMVELQKKVSEILGIALPSSEELEP